MIKRRDFLKMAAKAGAASLICAGKPTPGRGLTFLAPYRLPCAMTFRNRSKTFPSSMPRSMFRRYRADQNNRGVMTDQTLPGMTHIEIYMNWAGLEPERDRWDMREFDDMLRLSQQHGLKILAFPNVNNIRTG
jgi:hypothetical protein